MMGKHRVIWRLLGVLISLSLSGCANLPTTTPTHAATLAASATLSVDQTRSAAVPTATLTAHAPTATRRATLTATAAATPIPTPTMPEVLRVSPTPCPRARALTTCNLTQMSLRVQVGQGYFSDMALSPVGDRLAVATSLGLRFYTLPSLSDAGLFSTAPAQALRLGWDATGTRLLVGDDRGQVQLWDVATRVVTTVTTLTSTITGVAWSPDGRSIAVAGETMGELIDLTSGRRVASWSVAINLAYNAARNHTALAWSPDGRILAAGALTDTILLIEADTGHEVRQVSGLYAVNALAWSPDRRQLASASEAGLDIWTLSDPAARQRLPLPFGSQMVTALAWSPDGQSLAASLSGDYLDSFPEASVWDVRDGSSQHIPGTYAYSEFVADLAWTPSGHHLVLFLSSGAMRVINAYTLADVASVREPAGLWSPTWSPDSRWVSVGGARRAWVWEAKSGGLLRRIEPAFDGLYDVAWSPDGRYIATLSRDDRTLAVELWSSSTADRLASYESDFLPLTAAAWASDVPSHRMALGTFDGFVIWDADLEAQGLPAMDWFGIGDSGVASFAWSSDGGWLAVVTFDEQVQIWDLTARQTVFTTSGTSVAFSPSNDQLAVVSAGQMSIWNTATWRLTRVFTGSAPLGGSVAWQPTGSLLAAATINGAVDVFDASGFLLATLTDSNAGAYGLAWSPDGQELAATGGDGRLYIWGVP